jgi:S-adenosylmethionine decarboxylase
MSNPIGQHYLIDLHGIPAQPACDIQLIEQTLLQAAQLAKATVLQQHFHSFGAGQGVTGVLLLSESHISIHTWPEHQLASIDIFMCGQHQAQAAIQHIQASLPHSTASIQMIARGETSKALAQH